MAYGELITRAKAHGVSASYLNWRGERVEVHQDSLAAIVDALGDPPELAHPPELVSPSGLADQLVSAGPAASRSAGRPRMPSTRSWGFMVQLYSLRSRRSWGHGDLRDLADLARWAGRVLGASFILINPLHATESAGPVSNSPYLPMSRRYVSPLYLRIEDIEEFAQLSGAQRQLVEELAASLQAASGTPELIDRDRIWAAKRQALELVGQIKRSPEREASFRAFAEREGAELTTWVSWCALAELHGPDWRRWPAELADPVRARRLTMTGPLAERAAFHAWLQWLADDQLGVAQRTAQGAGMEIGVIGDLAVGVHPGGADAWAYKDLLVHQMSAGAPPDPFNQRGQTWGQPPFHPHLLAATGGLPLAELLRAAYRHVGGLRLDHVMSLMRLWWVPDGMPPDHGAYVNYDYRAMVGALTGEAVRAGAIAIGEDFGTKDAWMSRYLASQHVLGTELLWFAREPGGQPLLDPRRWRRGCLASVGTHDVPPVSALVAGDQVTVRASLGLVKFPRAQRRAAEDALARWRSAMVAERLLPPDARADPTPEELTVALYEFLTLTPALLIGISLADAVGDRRIQNIPGTSDEYPNWRFPLCTGEGQAVLLEDLDQLPLVHAVAGAVAGRLRATRGL